MSNYKNSWECPNCFSTNSILHKKGCTYCRCPYCGRIDGTHGYTCNRAHAMAKKEAAERQALESLPKKPLHFNANGFLQGDVMAEDAREQFQKLIKERK